MVDFINSLSFLKKIFTCLGGARPLLERAGASHVGASLCPERGR